jgi:hypothetical protein
LGGIAGLLGLVAGKDGSAGTLALLGVGTGSTSTGPFVLAAVFFTLSGTTITVRKQINVSSVVRNAVGQYTINFTTPLPDSNYGVVAGGRLPDNGGSDYPITTCTNNDSNGGGHNAYSTTALDVATYQTVSGPSEAGNVCVICFNPAAASSDVVATAFATLSGGVPSMQKSTNLSLAKNTTGVYRASFASALSNANYSLFGSAKLATAAAATGAFTGTDNSTLYNLHTTTNCDQSITNIGSGSTDPVNIGLLARDPLTSSPGTLAAVRFSVAAGVVTVISQNNVASVVRTSAGRFTVSFTSALADAYYGVISAAVNGTAGQNDQAPYIGPCGYTDGHSAYSTTAVDVVCHKANGGGPLDPSIVDLWIVDPSLLK